MKVARRGSEGAPAQQCAGATRQEGEKPVVGAIATGFDPECRGPSEGPFLLGHVRVEVDARRGNLLVPEPERDDGDVVAGLQKPHCAAVA